MDEIDSECLNGDLKLKKALLEKFKIPKKILNILQKKVII